MIHSSFEELIDDLSNYKGYSNSQELTQDELRDMLIISSEFVAFLDNKIYSEKEYILFKPTFNNFAQNADQANHYRRALGMARRYVELDKLPTIIKPEMVYFSVRLALEMQEELDLFAHGSGILNENTNHFLLFKNILTEKQKKIDRPKLYAVSITVDSVLVIDREYIVSTNPIEALYKLSFVNKIDSRSENINIEIAKITDVTA